VAPFVVTRSLTKRYGSLAALAECDLAVAPGEVLGLLGPNGAGKTTLLRLLMGFLRPTAGEARIDGLDCYADSVRVHERVAYLPGESRLFRAMHGRAVLRFFSRIRRGADYDRSVALAGRLGLDLSRQVALMSTGMRQKLALAVVLAAATPLLILDEPTSNLDPTVRGEVAALVREARSAGRTVLFSSHVLSEVEQACDRVCILRAGRLVHTQVMSELRRQHRIRARLTGPLPPVPDSLRAELVVRTDRGGEVEILAPGELAPLLGWLAGLPLAEVRIEPVGLQAIYDRYHADGEG
jgi:ABC-2 type transport system ATP-binding protein